MQGLQRTLRLFSLSEAQRVPLIGTHHLLDKRIFYIAPTEAINEVASTLTAYILDGVHKDKKGFYERAGFETLKARVSEVIDILFGDEENLKIEFSRTLTCVASEVGEKLIQEECSLGAVFATRLGVHVTAKFKDAWKRVQNGHVDAENLQLLEARTAMFADLYAKRIGFLDFRSALDLILPKASTPDLFDTLLFALLSRGLTELGIKLWRSSWEDITRQFDTIPDDAWGPAYASIWAVIKMFEEDVNGIGRECGVPFQEVQDFQNRDLMELCDGIRWRVLGEVDENEDEFGMYMD